MSGSNTPDTSAAELWEKLARYEGRIATYEQRFTKEHHDREHYEQDLEYAKEMFVDEIMQLITAHTQQLIAEFEGIVGADEDAPIIGYEYGYYPEEGATTRNEHRAELRTALAAMKRKYDQTITRR